MSNRTRAYNGWNSLLSGTLASGASTVAVDSAAGLVAPLYLVIDWDNPAKIEWVKVGTVVTNTLSVITRNQSGSVGDVTHDPGAKIRSVMSKMALDDLFTDIEALEAVDTSHAADSGDPHSAANYLKQVDTDALYLKLAGGVLTGDLTLAGAPDADLKAATKLYVDTVQALFDAHDGGTDIADHPEATISVRGFMSATDKTKLDGVETAATADQTAIDIRALGFFDITNDGATSGLDADLLDGAEGTAFHDAAQLTGTIDSARLPATAIEQGDLSNDVGSTSTTIALNLAGAKKLRDQKYSQDGDTDAVAGHRIFIQSGTPTMSDGDIWFDTTP